jgi:hypothetical protein
MSVERKHFHRALHLACRSETGGTVRRGVCPMHCWVIEILVTYR